MQNSIPNGMDEEIMTLDVNPLSIQAPSMDRSSSPTGNRAPHMFQTQRSPPFLPMAGQTSPSTGTGMVVQQYALIAPVLPPQAVQYAPRVPASPSFTPILVPPSPRSSATARNGRVASAFIPVTRPSKGGFVPNKTPTNFVRPPRSTPVMRSDNTQISSPRDQTPLVMDGAIVDRNSIPQIVVRAGETTGTTSIAVSAVSPAIRLDMRPDSRPAVQPTQPIVVPMIPPIPQPPSYQQQSQQQGQVQLPTQPHPQSQQAQLPTQLQQPALRPSQAMITDASSPRLTLPPTPLPRPSSPRAAVPTLPMPLMPTSDNLSFVPAATVPIDISFPQHQYQPSQLVAQHIPSQIVGMSDSEIIAIIPSQVLSPPSSPRLSFVSSGTVTPTQLQRGLSQDLSTGVEMVEPSQQSHQVVRQVSNNQPRQPQDYLIDAPPPLPPFPPLPPLPSLQPTIQPILSGLNNSEPIPVLRRIPMRAASPTQVIPSSFPSGSPRTGAQSPASQGAKVQLQSQPVLQPQPQPQVQVLEQPAVPNYSAMSEEEQGRFRAQFVIRFGILRDAWRSLHIVDPTPDATLENIHAQYERYIMQIHVSQSVDQYKVYMVILWLGIEVICIKWLGLNASGYTISQLRRMNTYERLLIELGERNYGVGTSTWPIEVRIAFVALTNAVVFIAVKTLASFLGEGPAEAIMNTLINALSPAPSVPAQGQPAADGVSPVPAPAPTAGFDLPGLIANLGGMFTGGLGRAPAPSQPTSQPTTPGRLRQPRFTE
jgi:hypothetical protein